MSEREEVVLCGASAYNKKFYLNQDFKGLPDSIKDELKIMCVLFTEDIGGIFQVVFDEDGNLEFRTSSDICISYVNRDYHRIFLPFSLHF